MHACVPTYRQLLIGAGRREKASGGGSWELPAPRPVPWRIDDELRACLVVGIVVGGRSALLCRNR